MKDTLKEQEIEYIIHLSSLTKKIAGRYKTANAYKAGIEGLEIGLKQYIKNKRHDTQLDTYLTWYIKTAIEKELGLVNPDTKAYESIKC